MSKPSPEPDPGRKPFGGADAVNLGLSFAVAMALFSYAGHWLDMKRGGGILGTLLGVFAAFGYGAYEVWKIVREDGGRG
jgi:hypothetical protein